MSTLVGHGGRSTAYLTSPGDTIPGFVITVMCCPQGQKPLLVITFPRLR